MLKKPLSLASQLTHQGTPEYIFRHPNLEEMAGIFMLINFAYCLYGKANENIHILTYWDVPQSLATLNGFNLPFCTLIYVCTKISATKICKQTLLDYSIINR